MLNDTTIQMIAQAIIANTKVLQTLVEALPREAVAKVEEKVATVAPAAPVAPAPAPVVQAPAQPVQMPQVVQNVAANAAPSPAPVAMPVMPALPVFEAPAPAPAPAAPVAVPFKDVQELTQYVLNVYRDLGSAKGMQIQKVMDKMGIKNINDTRPDQFNEFYAGVEAIKAAG